MGIAKKVLITCGAGAVTSAIVEEKLKILANQRGWRMTIVSCNAREVTSYLNGVDFVITTTPLRGVEGIPVLQGLPFLSGIGEEALKEEIAKQFS
jgi:PTS system galactitol-specific IIB component